MSLHILVWNFPGKVTSSPDINCWLTVYLASLLSIFMRHSSIVIIWFLPTRFFHFSHKIEQRNNRSSPFSTVWKSFSFLQFYCCAFRLGVCQSLPRKCHLYCVEKVTKGGTWLDILSFEVIVIFGTNLKMSSFLLPFSNVFLYSSVVFFCGSLRNNKNQNPTVHRYMSKRKSVINFLKRWGH